MPETTSTTTTTSAPPAAAPAPASAPVERGEAASIDWAALNADVDPGADDDLDDGSSSDGSTSVEQPPDKATGTPPEPKTTTPETPATPTEGAPTEGTPAEVQTPAEPVPPEPPTELTPEQKAEKARQYQEWRTATEAQLEAQYQFTEDEAAALQTEPEKVLPKMAAKLFMDVQEAAVQSVLRWLPQAIGQVNQGMTRDQSALKAFTDANPDLNDSKYKDDIMSAAQSFRARNPKATPQEAIAKIGKMVRVMHDLPMPDGKGEVKTDAVPAGKKKVDPPTPHRPASSRASAPPQTKSEKENVWAELARDDDDE